jgi:hypothetical protein
VNGSGSPFGSWGPLVAAFAAIATLGSAVAVHVANIFRTGVASGDAFLDNAALLVLGVVLGVGAIGGTASRALVEADAAHKRLDAAGAPPAPPQHPAGP